jgi:hypothetical protein
MSEETNPQTAPEGAGSTRSSRAGGPAAPAEPKCRRRFRTTRYRRTAQSPPFGKCEVESTYERLTRAATRDVISWPARAGKPTEGAH